MTSQDTFLNFAYGSNMSTGRLRKRVGSARPRGIGHLNGHALRWHKRSCDGSGKCDAETTGVNSYVIWGVLFEINRSEKFRLDQAEGLHHGYEEKEVEVVTGHRSVKALMYYATDTDRSLLTYDWYKAFVVSGAREHGLPESYVHHLEQVQSVRDPDVKRAAKNKKLLTAENPG